MHQGCCCSLLLATYGILQQGLRCTTPNTNSARSRTSQNTVDYYTARAPRCLLGIRTHKQAPRPHTTHLTIIQLVHAGVCLACFLQLGIHNVSAEKNRPNMSRKPCIASSSASSGCLANFRQPAKQVNCQRDMLVGACVQSVELKHTQLSWCSSPDTPEAVFCQSQPNLCQVPAWPTCQRAAVES